MSKMYEPKAPVIRNYRITETEKIINIKVRRNVALLSKQLRFPTSASGTCTNYHFISDYVIV